MKFGILTDLHLGHHGNERCWHNRLFFDQAESVTRAAVGVLNGQELDAVFVLGDITQAGEEGQLRLARDILDGLETPWFSVPGNHDRPALRAGLFDRLLAGHLVPDFFLHGDIAIAGLRERLPEGNPDEYHLDPRRVNALMSEVERRRPDTLLLFSHMPLVNDAEWAAEHGGKDAGGFAEGEALLEELAAKVRVIACCGHQHWHHLTVGQDWLQCATAALIEYPMEVRVLTLARDRLSIATLPVADEIAAASLLDAPWVCGREEDRKAVMRL